MAAQDNGSVLARFIGFERLLGSALVKAMYYIGLAVGAVCIVFGVIGGVFSGEILVAVMSLVVGAIGLVFWRFCCELALLSFQIYNRLGEIRDRLPAP